MSRKGKINKILLYQSDNFTSETLQKIFIISTSTLKHGSKAAVISKQLGCYLLLW